MNKRFPGKEGLFAWKGDLLSPWGNLILGNHLKS
jgi:hypothetical protein